MDRTSGFSAARLQGPFRGQRPRQSLVSPATAERYRPATGTGFRKRALTLIGATVTWGLASPATAAPSTKLVRCGAETCLRIAGHREDPASIVSINDHVVPVEGKRGWRIDLPVEVVREWSAPYARTIDVSLQDPETQRETNATVDLPIGLLGLATNLASLVVSVR